MKLDEYSQLLFTESETDSEGSLDLDATQGPSGSTQVSQDISQDTIASSPESPTIVKSPKKLRDSAAKPRKRQINHFLAVGNPTTSDSETEQSQSLLKRRKSTKKGTLIFPWLQISIDTFLVSSIMLELP
ncbi:uncharacterized protein LOC134228354 [Saccostrea cucullata]|uniref:uncharacterized protein LOC134228354 n=1 Tax=Saccostrea cuccullata TaxID=36930 RepID=UPI002ED17724